MWNDLCTGDGTLYPPEVELAQHANYGQSENRPVGLGIPNRAGRYHVWMESDPLSCPSDAYFVYESCQMSDQTKQTCFYLRQKILESEILRPFLIQSGLSVENGRFRLKPKSGFLTHTVEKGLFRLNFCTEFRLGDPVEKLDLFDWICQSNNSVEKVLHLFFEPIGVLISPQNTHPHAHTPIPGTM